MKKINLSELNFSNLIKKGALLTAGTIDDCNAMTIGWASFGYIWRKEFVSCYVKPNRYTYKYMEDNDFFTISFFDDCYSDLLNYFGTVSGRDEDKIKKSGLSIFSQDNGLFYKESKITILCRKMYYQDLDKKVIEDSIISKYYEKESPHRVYYGEVVSVYQK